MQNPQLIRLVKRLVAILEIVVLVNTPLKVKLMNFLVMRSRDLIYPFLFNVISTD